MVLDVDFAERRQANARRIEASQRATAQALEDMVKTKKSIPPFAPYMVCPEVESPLGRDAHLERTGDLIKLKPAKAYVPTHRGFEGLIATGQPWATYERPQPSIFGRTQNLRPHGGGGGRAAPDRAELLTKYQEWQLQKNNYQPDIAAAMRIDVRKSAYLAVNIADMNKPSESHTSANIKGAMGEGVPPHLLVKKPSCITPDVYFPKEREL